jgi:integral membrane protein
MKKLWGYYNRFQPFTEPEAWFLFKIAAFSEAIGWTMLGLSVVVRSLSVPGSEIAVQLSGRTHGTLFLMYIFAVLLLSPSLGWSFGRMLIAGLCSVPPYGSLVYEQLSAQYRSWNSFKNVRSAIRYKFALKNT